MVDIISKRKGPRREDVAAKRMISDNWSTISRLADQFSNGGYSRSRKANATAKEEPALDNLSIHIIGGGPAAVEPDPIVQVSRNHRVIVMDARSGKQLQFLGTMRFQGRQKYFSLATAGNNFVSTVDADTELKLADLNGVVIESDEIEEAFVAVIRERLEL